MVISLLSLHSTHGTAKRYSLSLVLLGNVLGFKPQITPTLYGRSIAALTRIAAACSVRAAIFLSFCL